MLSSLKNHAPTLISHLCAQELVDMHQKMPSEYQSKKFWKDKDKRERQSAAEIDKFLSARQKQKDYKIVENACIELLHIGYDIYMHVEKMRKCSCVSMGEKPGAFGILERHIFNSTKAGE